MYDIVCYSNKVSSNENPCIYLSSHIFLIHQNGGKQALSLIHRRFITYCKL